MKIHIHIHQRKYGEYIFEKIKIDPNNCDKLISEPKANTSNNSNN